MVGLRKMCWPWQMTTGISEALTWKRSRSACDVAIGVEVDVGMGMVVAGEELPQAQRAGRVARAHDHDVAVPALDEGEAAQDEGADEDFAQLGVARDQSAERLGGQLQELSGLGDAPENQALLAGDHGHLAGERAGVVVGDGALAVERGLDDLHGSRRGGRRRGRRFVRGEQDLAGRDLPQMAQGPDAVDLRGRQRREDLGLGIEGAGDRGEDIQPFSHQ